MADDISTVDVQPVDIQPVDTARLADLGRLFAASGTCTGCWCTWFLVSSREFGAGWGTRNRERFEEFTEQAGTPVGLLAYRDGEPVGWCATGPRDRYARAMRSPLLRSRDRTEDAAVWLVPCFFVRRSERGRGITRSLLTGAVDLARQGGATAVEGFPLAGTGRRSADAAFVGTEPLFAACGFTVTGRPSPNRAVMRRTLAGDLARTAQPASEE